MSATVADVMVATLKASGVRRVYGIPGDSLNGFTDALRRDGAITWEHVRHEEAASFAAAAEAALTGDLAVCAASCGPGNLHLINGLFDANRSGVPVLAIAAHIPRAEIGGSYFQETHPQELFRECSVYCELVSVPDQLLRILEIAMRAALQRGGAAVVVVPGEVFLADAPDAAPPSPLRAVSPVVVPDEQSLAAAARVLNEASRVTILAGAGCAGAHDQLLRFAGAAQAPVLHAFRGKEFVEYDNPYDVGMTGLIGFSSGYRAMEHCDALVMLGTDFPYRPFYPEGVPVIQVDVRGERIGRRVPVSFPLVGTVKDTLEALLPLLTATSDSRHLDRMTAHYRRARARLDRLAEPGQGESPLHPQFVAATINRLAAEDAVFTADVGTPCIWAARYLRMNGTRRLIGSFNHGTMANALPHAIGAQASHPGRQVIALSGDGGLAMLLGEIITLRQQELPVKIVVFNNGALSFVELEMKAAGIVTFGTNLDNPDFAGIARACGLHGQRVEKAGDLEGALRAAFEHDGAALALFDTDAGYPGGLSELVSGGSQALQRGAEVLAKAEPVDLESVSYLPLLGQKVKIICVGINYRGHARETHYDVPPHPTVFARFPTSLTGHKAPLVRPWVSEQLDYEGELVAVIGKGGRHIAKGDALEHVIGYSIFNDGSVRDFQMKTPQWTVGKNFDSTGAFGPFLVTADEVPAGGSGLQLTTRLNGQIVQQADTSEMIYDVASVIAFLSEAMTFHPGDVLVMGTPPGVGFERDPQLFMKSGDVCEVEIEGIGLLSNPILDEASPVS